MNKLVLLTSVLVTVQAGNFFQNLKQEHQRLTQASAADSTDPNLAPLVGRNLVSVILTDILSIITNPSWASVMSSFVDFGSFFIVPFLGGYVNSTVYNNYIKDPLTYQHAGLDQNYLYASSMLFTKDAIYTASGRPDFFKIKTDFVQNALAPDTV